MSGINHCGTCSLCCKLLAIPELDKPCNQWCHLVQLGKPADGYRHGCSIYDHKPNSCNIYECAYVTSQDSAEPWPIELRPDHLHMVVSEPVATKFATAHIDPQYEKQVKDSPIAATMLRALIQYRPVMVLVGGVYECLLADKPDAMTKEEVREILELDKEA